MERVGQMLAIRHSHILCCSQDRSSNSGSAVVLPVFRPAALHYVIGERPAANQSARHILANASDWLAYDDTLGAGSL